jgi:hypothetical protein
MPLRAACLAHTASSVRVRGALRILLRHCVTRSQRLGRLERSQYDARAGMLFQAVSRVFVTDPPLHSPEACV